MNIITFPALCLSSRKSQPSIELYFYYLICNWILTLFKWAKIIDVPFIDINKSLKDLTDEQNSFMLF